MVSREEASPEVAELALGALHARLGARFVEERGIAVPADYGDPGAELAALRETCAMVDLSWASRLELRGRDRHRFLNGLLTANTKDLSPGHGVYGLLLTKQGRVLADVYVTALDDRLWLELPAGTAVPIRRHLESYRVADDVEAVPLDDLAILGVLGPGAAAALGEPAAGLALDRSRRAAIGGCEVQITRRRVLGIDGFVLWVPSSLGQELFAGLVEGPPAGRAAGLGALEARRIEVGVGRWGVDFGEETVANDTGLVAAAIDFTKGCYLGQEIVARIHYRGKPSALCCPLEVTARSEAPPLPSIIRAVAENSAAGDACGSLTSATPGREAASWLAIGTLSRRALDAAAPMMLEGGGVVTRRAAAG